ncbi:hypothetical protein [Sphingomonas sp. Leaf62]|uniref:hypothetical protein n=1 Tax=Sphingomonas sp. Leaf62 TaxID=1736228 RepID=UPI000A8CFA0A|nr:hypothetical protein [Sphingomonas sp. Leaf62]
MAQEYTLLGLVGLEPGSWADWFSGSMSALAVAVALSAYPIANRQKQKADRQRDAEIGRGIGWKVLTLLNQNADIDRHIKGSLAIREPMYPPNMKFPLVRPLGVPDRKPQELNQSETDLLLKSQSAELLIELELCFGRYSSIIFAMNEYKARHEALYELMPQPVANQGMTFTHRIRPEEAARIKPYTLMLEALLDSMIALLAENMAKLQSCLKQYNLDMARHFGKPLMSFEIDTEVAQGA